MSKTPRKGVWYSPNFARLTDSVTAGVLLSQLLYWHDKGDTAEGWIYKSMKEWQEETGLTRSEFETARKKLRDLGIVEERVGNVSERGIRNIVYYRLDVETLHSLYAQILHKD